MAADTAQAPPAKAQPRRRMPCGAEKCLNCHGGCGAKTADYTLEGLEFETPNDDRRR